MNVQKGNMYGFVTHTWNTVKGACPHDCVYCYMKQFPQHPIRFDEKELKTDLGSENYIFVGSSNDLWADQILDEWIERTLEHCSTFKDNQYLFQSKNPRRFEQFLGKIPPYAILCTTIETNREDLLGNAPARELRASHIKGVGRARSTMITIEPIMDFDLDEFVKLIESVNPDQINIGADSKGHHLPEPGKDKLLSLISALDRNYPLFLKPNLDRLLGGSNC